MKHRKPYKPQSPKEIMKTNTDDKPNLSPFHSITNIYKGASHSIDMKNYTLRLKIRNKDRNNEVRTIQHSRDDYQDIKYHKKTRNS